MNNNMIIGATITAAAITVIIIAYSLSILLLKSPLWWFSYLIFHFV